MSVLDIFICVLYFIFILSIGWLCRSRATTITDFVVAGRRIGPYLGVASLAGTELGLITVMYNAQKGVTSGLAALHIGLIAGIVTLCIGLTGFIVVPLRRLKVLTIPEFYEHRFDRQTRILGAVIMVIGGVLNMGLFLKVAALFVATILGISITGWPLLTIMTILLILVLLYTLFGGMVSVIITDFIQFILLSIGLGIMLFLLISTIGWHEAIDYWTQFKGADVFNPIHETSGFGYGYIIWMIITAGLVSTAIWPTALSRALVMKDEHAVKTQYILAAIPMMGRFMIPMLIGFFSTVFLGLHHLSIESSLTAFPQVALAILPTGLLGLLIAGLCAAMMSTFDGYLLCWSTVMVRDIFSILKSKTWSDEKQLSWIKRCIICCGIFMWYWGLIYQGSDDIWDYLTITGAIYFTGAISVIIGGLYWKKASTYSAKVTLCSGLVALIGLEPIRNALGLQLSGTSIGLFTVCFSTILFITMSYIKPDTSSTIKESL